MFLPAFYDKNNAGKIYPIDYRKIRSDLSHVSVRRKAEKTAIVLVACQNQFMESSSLVYRIPEFIYRNMEKIDDIFAPLIVYPYITIFSSTFWVDRQGRLIKPGAVITPTGMSRGDFRINPSVKDNFPSTDKESLEKAVLEYIKTLNSKREDFVVSNFPLAFSSVNSALVSVVEEAIFSHSVIYHRQPYIGHAPYGPFSEYESVFMPVIPPVFAGLGIISSQNKTLANCIAKYETIVFVGMVSEIVIASLVDFMDLTSYRGKIYSNHDELSLWNPVKEGKNKKNTQIISKYKNIITCKLSKLDL